MTGDLAAAAEGCHIFSGCGYPAPGLDDFNFRKLFSIGGWNVTKPELIAVLCVIIVIAFFWAAFAKPKMIPGKTQSLGEMAVLAVRDQIVRPVLGAKGDSYMPFLTSLFFWILVMNLMELIPVLQFPSMARIGFVWPLVLFVYGLYWYLASLSIGLLYAAGSLFMVFFVFLLELLVDLLQAFIFTTLTATYIADSLEHGH